jgi:hypothetical protein
MRRRGGRAAPPYVAELERYAAEYTAAATGGDSHAADLLRSVRSYLDLLTGSVPDKQVVDLFLFCAGGPRVVAGAAMRRRSRPGNSGVPEQLARFIASEWPDAGCPHEALRMWEDACAGWLGADSTRAPKPGSDARANRWWLAGGSNRALPFGEYGDAVDVLREAIRIGHGMPACSGEARPAVHWVNGPPETA